MGRSKGSAIWPEKDHDRRSLKERRQMPVARSRAQLEPFDFTRADLVSQPE
jgi:hypothetical protein